MKLKKAKGVAGGLEKVIELQSKLPKPLTKLNIISAGTSALFSAGEGIYNTYKAITLDDPKQKTDYAWKATGNLGDLLMSTATLVAPACPPAAAGMAVVGGVLWGASAIYQNRKAIGRALKAAGQTVTDLGKKVGNGLKKLGNLFSSWNS